MDNRRLAPAAVHHADVLSAGYCPAGDPVAAAKMVVGAGGSCAAEIRLFGGVYDYVWLGIDTQKQ